MTTSNSTAPASYFDLEREAIYDEYRAALGRGQVTVQQCRLCSASQFPPALGCSACGGSDLTWTVVERGTVVAGIRRPDATDGTLVVDIGNCRILAAAVLDVPEAGEEVDLTVAEVDGLRCVVASRGGQESARP